MMNDINKLICPNCGHKQKPRDARRRLLRCGVCSSDQWFKEIEEDK